MNKLVLLFVDEEFENTDEMEVVTEITDTK